jgi:hypothetical protein
MDKGQHYVLVLANDLNEGVKIYIDTKNSLKKTEYMKKITLKGLKNLKDGDVLYVATHGIYNEGPPKSAANLVQNKKDDLDPSQFYDLLVDNGLPAKTLSLKIFACFSAGLNADKNARPTNLDDTFAGKVSSLLRQTHPKITVYGYVNQTKFGFVTPDGHKGAGVPVGGSDSDMVRASQRRVAFLIRTKTARLGRRTCSPKARVRRASGRWFRAR